MDSLLRVSLDIHKNGNAVLAVAGELDMASGPRLLTWVRELPPTPRKRTFVDLTRLRFCDAAGVRTLLTVSQELDSHGTPRTTFIAPSKASVRKILAITGVATYVPFHTSTEVAILGDADPPWPFRERPFRSGPEPDETRSDGTGPAT
jgi:anti-sigma B factor antagonist